jgi:hypothetical protein
MTENRDANSLGTALLDGNDGLQNDRGISRPVRAAGYVPPVRYGRGSRAPGARRQVHQGGVRPQERAPNYPVVAAWAGFLLFIAAGAFVLGMAIHNEAHAKPPAPRTEPIYYCATGEEIPLYEPCRDRKDQRDI